MIIDNKIIAIDGHSSTGKSTFAKEIAKKYGLIYIDTGALYRGVTYFAKNNGIIDESGNIDQEKLQSSLNFNTLNFEFKLDGANRYLYLNNINIEEQIRGLEIARLVSKIATIQLVRNFVDSILKKFGERGGVIMDGRDIGTVVFPNADLKIFMTADAKIRAQRRYQEIIQRGESANFDEVLNNILERDHLDQTRANAPLRRADDAILLDNSYMTKEDQDIWIEKIIEQRWG
jgi:cytidylate kinase